MTKSLFIFPLRDNWHETIDGDTVKVEIDRGWSDRKSTSLRLAGLNAPEKRTSRALEKSAALLVTDLVKKWLADRQGKLFYATSDEKPKFDGRTIGRLYAEDPTYEGPGLLQGVDCLNAYLLGLKVVKPYDGGTRVPFTDEELNEIISICEKQLL